MTKPWWEGIPKRLRERKINQPCRGIERQTLYTQKICWVTGSMFHCMAGVSSLICGPPEMPAGMLSVGRTREGGISYARLCIGAGWKWHGGGACVWRIQGPVQNCASTTNLWLRNTPPSPTQQSLSHEANIFVSVTNLSNLGFWVTVYNNFANKFMNGLFRAESRVRIFKVLTLWEVLRPPVFHYFNWKIFL